MCTQYKSLCHIVLLSSQQQMSGKLQVSASGRQPELRFHELRQLRLVHAVRLSSHDSGLLGKPLSAGTLSCQCVETVYYINVCC